MLGSEPTYGEKIRVPPGDWVRCGLIVSIPDLCPLSYFYVFPRDNIRKPLTLCITQSLNSQIHFHCFTGLHYFAYKCQTIQV